MHLFPQRLALGECGLFIVIVVLIFAASLQVANEPAREAPQEDFAALATKARESGKTSEAIANYQRAVQARPDWQEGWWYLGTLQYDSDHYAEAIPAFEKLTVLNPNLGAAWGFLGLCEFETRNYSQALEHLRKAQSLDSGDDPETYRVAKYHLALLENREGEFDKASSLLTATFADDASDQIRFALGLSLLRIPLLPGEVNHSQDALIQSAGDCAASLRKRDFSKALASFQGLIKNHPDAPYIHYAYGAALASASRYEDALEQLRVEQKISPTSELPYIAISSLELQQTRTAPALTAAKTAVRVAPNSAGAHQALADILAALNKKDEAAEESRKAAKLPPAKTREPRMLALYGQANPGQHEGYSPAAGSESFAQSANQAASLQKAGDLNRAIDEYEKALTLQPDWDQGLWNLATLYYASGAYEKAVPNLKRWLQRKPQEGTAWAMLGLAEFKNKDYDNSLIHLQRGQQLGFAGNNDAIRAAKYHLAILLNRSAQHDQAFRVLSGIAKNEDDQQIEVALGMALLHMPMLPEQLDESKTKLVTATGKVGFMLQDSKYDQAMAKLQALLQQYPSTPFLHYVYGTALASLSQYGEAVAQFTQETAISPGSELAWIQLASIALKQHEPQNALSSGQQAVKLAPNSAEAHYILGRTYLDLGQDAPAIQELEEAKKLAPASPEVRFNLAKAYAKSKLPTKAEEERTAFTRLKSLADQQRNAAQSQSYTGSHMDEFANSESNSNEAPTSQKDQ